ncbi:MAG: lysophospholipase [Sulfurimonas sp.]|uniref:alpha/beta fold hydrolase n=1 Tax=Sulfurimonas sp. TaxID=2022749 RepID=UPI00260B4CA7|nr:alpha/beta fold hydrolase [Sulfurimonas sp.]MCW8894319.1 lysophospholipase [Sulfurimonas sp.]MCW8954223.1 lysophospholipase [Sulfurimonas sp.]MCW9067866.1 lysophospholipase [Sulfurimonas sp.]
MSKNFISLLLSLFITSNSYANDREKSICGSFQEPFLFWLWSSMAPSPDSSRVADIKFIKPSEFKTSDEKILRGYKYMSNDGYNNTPPKGYILVVMGNAMVSDLMIKELKKFSEHNYDVYVYDYRGYANSEGNRRINAIIHDHKEIAIHLNKSYNRKLLYGTSLGGMIVLNMIGLDVEYDAAVIDSAPSFLSPHGCPKSIDPVENLPKDASKILVITGEKDEILSKSMTSPLRDIAQSRGAATFNGENYAHPFQDKNREIYNHRMELILNHLDATKPQTAEEAQEAAVSPLQ